MFVSLPIINSVLGFINSFKIFSKSKKFVKLPEGAL